MENLKFLNWLSPLIILLGIITVIIGETSDFYFPIIYVTLGMVIVAVILIIQYFIKK
mgnify:CR=1